MAHPQIEPSSRPWISPHPPRTEDNTQDDLWFGLNRHGLRAMISLKSYAAPEDLHLAKVVDGHGEVAEDLQRGVLFRPAGGGLGVAVPCISRCVAPDGPMISGALDVNNKRRWMKIRKTATRNGNPVIKRRHYRRSSRCGLRCLLGLDGDR